METDNKTGIRFVSRIVDGVPAVEIISTAGERVGIVYVEEDGAAIVVMSDSFDGTFSECVQFRHAEMASGHRVPPVIKMRFRVRGSDQERTEKRKATANERQ